MRSVNENLNRRSWSCLKILWTIENRCAQEVSKVSEILKDNENNENNGNNGKYGNNGNATGKTVGTSVQRLSKLSETGGCPADYAGRMGKAASAQELSRVSEILKDDGNTGRSENTGSVAGKSDKASAQELSRVSEILKDDENNEKYGNNAGKSVWSSAQRLSRVSESAVARLVMLTAWAPLLKGSSSSRKSLTFPRLPRLPSLPSLPGTPKWRRQLTNHQSLFTIRISLWLNPVQIGFNEFSGQIFTAGFEKSFSEGKIEDLNYYTGNKYDNRRDSQQYYTAWRLL